VTAEACDNEPVIPEHMGALHPYEQLIVLVLAFGPLLLLAVTIRIARKRTEHEEN
jgi:hypothetical protein